MFCVQLVQERVEGVCQLGLWEDLVEYFADEEQVAHWGDVRPELTADLGELDHFGGEGTELSDLYINPHSFLYLFKDIGS